MGKAEETRRFIIEKTAPILNKKGIAGTSISDIIKATGLQKGGIYGNFKKGKIEIVHEVFDYISTKLYAGVSESVMQHQKAPDRLFALLSFYSKYVYNPTVEGGCPIINFSTEVDDTDPVLQEKVANFAKKVERAVARLVQAGIDSGEFRKDVNPEEFATRFMIMIEGAIMLSKLQRTNKPMNLSVKTLKNEVKSLMI
ncbi:MAG: TetR family transcriptional regulator C-terminal domain-containing protein [Bacteroidota bacterium]